MPDVGIGQSPDFKSSTTRFFINIYFINVTIVVDHYMWLLPVVQFITPTDRIIIGTAKLLFAGTLL